MIMTLFSITNTSHALLPYFLTPTHKNKISSLQSKFRTFSIQPNSIRSSSKENIWQRSAKSKINYERKKRNNFRVKYHQILLYTKVNFEPWKMLIAHCVRGRWFCTINPCHLPFWNDEKWIFSLHTFLFYHIGEHSVILMKTMMVISWINSGEKFLRASENKVNWINK